jgi:small subunit ribosomal protein S7
MSSEPTPETSTAPEIKIFGRWSTKNIQISDRGLEKYISLKPVIIPHTFGRHEHRRFGKEKIPIVERFINRLMTPGWASRRSQSARQAGLITGKKSTAIRIVRSAFEIIHLRTGKNPIQILIQAIVNAAPREETTRISYGGISYHTACDVAPLRRIDLALRFISESIWRRSFSTIESVEEVIADELIAAATADSRSNAVRRREEKERMALSAR